MNTDTSNTEQNTHTAEDTATTAAASAMDVDAENVDVAAELIGRIANTGLAATSGDSGGDDGAASVGAAGAGAVLMKPADLFASRDRYA